MWGSTAGLWLRLGRMMNQLITVSKHTFAGACHDQPPGARREILCEVVGLGNISETSHLNHVSMPAGFALREQPRTDASDYQSSNSRCKGICELLDVGQEGASD